MDLRHSDWNQTALWKTVIRTYLTAMFIILIIWISYFGRYNSTVVTQVLCESVVPYFLVSFILFGLSRVIFEKCSLTNEFSFNNEFAEVKELA